MQDLATYTALVQGQLSIISGIRDAEVAARDAISGNGIAAIVNELFPGVDSTLLGMNQDIPNFLQQGVGRYTRAIVRGTLNWEWDGDSEAPPQNPGDWLNAKGRTLVQDATTDAIVSGKFAFFPSIDAQGQLRITTLSGFLWPIYAPGDVSEVLALLQISSYWKDAKILYKVARYSPGLVEVFSDLQNWRTYATNAPQQTFEQPHAPDRLPVAFRIVGRDANREPEGIAQTAMSAFRRYVRYAVLLGFIATRGGFEERVVKSDALFQLAKSDPKHSLVQDIKKVGVNLIRLMDSGGSYERLDPVGLREYREQEQSARDDIMEALNLPNTDGTKLAGVALAEKREAYTEVVSALAGNMGEALTEVNDLCAGLRPAQYSTGWNISLTPRFSRDIDAERANLREDFKTGGLPQSAFLSGLQSLGVTYVTDQMVEAARATESLDQPIQPEQVDG